MTHWKSGSTQPPKGLTTTRGVAVALLCLSTVSAYAQDRVADTVHNLSSSGPGSVRAQSEPEICLFCHASHTFAGARALWNRDLPVSSYRIYESSTLDARPGQPTGASKLCLSCHDGTIALGSVLSRSDRIRMVGSDHVPAGLANLGTDLSDDHPVSFVFAPGIAAADRQLMAPSSLPREIKLDTNNQMQCTACHNPHHNTYGNFLVMDNTFGKLCTNCHTMDGWQSSMHRSSEAAVSGSSTGDWPHDTVSANACRSCHRSHTSGGRQRLLIFEAEEENCLSCHDGTVARTNMRAELDKMSGHDPRRYQGAHDPVEGAWSKTPHVECEDCHNPHAVQSAVATASFANTTAVGPTLAHAKGVTLGGSQIDSAQHEYEVCLRCHSETTSTTQKRVGRQSQQPNLRLKFSPMNPSFHPVTNTVANTDTVSLVPGMASGTMIRCTDCHNNDTGPRAGGGGPDGPHGSIYPSLLERNYTVRDDAAESQHEYAMCYKCHRRASILSDESFPEHRRHIVIERTPCSACHDPHGISATQSVGSDHTHLINFDTRIVRPEGATGRMGFRDRGRFAGSCTMECHGATHVDLEYGMMTPVRLPTQDSGRTIRRIK